MKTSHFDSGIALGAAIDGQVSPFRTLTPPAAFLRHRKPSEMCFQRRHFFSRSARFLATVIEEKTQQHVAIQETINNLI